MGQSTDGILFYGYIWEDEVELEEIGISEEVSELWGKEHPVLVGSHCSCDYPLPYLYIQATEVTAARGYPQKIDPVVLASAPWNEWDVQLAAFAVTHGIDLTGAEGPGWFLCSMWC